MTAEDLPDTTDGPERFHGSRRCVDHHAGIRDGLSDWCCCCNPCLYERPEGFTDSHCCRCVPRVLCLTFIPDDPPTNECCRTISTAMFAEHSGPGVTTYSGTVAGHTFDLLLSSEFDLNGNVVGPCRWRVTCASLSVDITAEVDHVFVTCLEPPAVTVTGVVDNNLCTGRITLVNNAASKVPFENRRLEQLEPTPGQYVSVPYSPCECDSVPRFLCVSGRRHAFPASEEYVEFEWREDIGDRWEYNPPCGVPADREIIYLRGPHIVVSTLVAGSGSTNETQRLTMQGTPVSGDFVLNYRDPVTLIATATVAISYDATAAVIQTALETIVGVGNVSCTGGPINTSPVTVEFNGSLANTNIDPLIPTNPSNMQGDCWIELDFEFTGDLTDDWGEMLPFSPCDCSQHVRSTASGSRSITIHAGPCGRWQYRCGSCRCACQEICVFGSLNGEDFTSVPLQWDGLGWAADGFPLRFDVVRNECGDCIIRASGDLTYGSDLNDSDPIECGDFMSFEMYGDYDADEPTIYNWVWGQCQICPGCTDSVCGPCTAERCGGPPETVYLDLYAEEITLNPDDPYDTLNICQLTVSATYWKRWSTTKPHTLDCGYIGFAIVICDTQTLILRFEIDNFATSIGLWAMNPAIGTWYQVFVPIPLTLVSCDPYTATTGVISDPMTICKWGCVLIDQWEVTVTE